ncbi:MAG: MmoB/DmpM family protein [Gammaproteobacteria bacterium]|nr:MmoB/DmpM family protein [Gammaproteobacteria bacterium]
MTNDTRQKRFVGPIIKTGEIGDAVLEAIREDNDGRKIEVEEHASYMRIKVQGECVIRFATVGDMLGRDVTRSDIEANMPALEGFIRVDSEQMRFLSE